jgi:MscS family membrane protein
VLLALMLAAGVARGQEQAPEGPRATPKASVVGYLEACGAGDYAGAASFLNLRPLPAARRADEGPRLARHLEVVLDRKLWVDVEALSSDPAGHGEDGLSARQDRVGVIESATGPVEIRVERVGSEWVIAARTVTRIPALYDEFGYGSLGDYIPAPLFEIKLLKLELWQWIGLLAAGLVAWLLAIGIAMALASLVGRLAARTRTDLDDRLLRAAMGPLTATLTVALFYPLTLPLGLSVLARQRVGGLCKGLVVVALAWLAMRLIDIGSEVLRSRLVAQGNAAASSLLPVARRLAKAFLLVIALLSVLDNLGYDVLGLLAGLGIAGLAVALAAQKTFENFLGSMEIIGDRPVSVGDFCRFGDRIGTVEDIGLRSVRIRTLDRTLVTVPNSAFASLELENFAERDCIRFHATIGVRYETTAEQMRFLLVELKKLLASHSRVLADPARVRFVSFGACSLDLEIFAYVDTSDWGEFLAVREDLLLRIMDVVEASGSGFAFPSQTLYLGKDDGLDQTASRAAEQRVRELREQSALPLPDPSAETLRELENSLSWPPEGSALGPGARS